MYFLPLDHHEQLRGTVSHARLHIRLDLVSRVDDYLARPVMCWKAEPRRVVGEGANNAALLASFCIISALCGITPNVKQNSCALLPDACRTSVGIPLGYQWL